MSLTYYVWATQTPFRYRGDIITKDQFTSVKRYSGTTGASGFYLCCDGNKLYMLKKKEDMGDALAEDKDNIQHEYKVGLELNKYYNFTPHLVYTHHLYYGLNNHSCSNHSCSNHRDSSSLNQRNHANPESQSSSSSSSSLDCGRKSKCSSKNNHCYLLLEYLQGNTVDPEKLTVHERIRVLIQVSACLETLKDAGFTHYNLHKDNVMLVPLDSSYIIDYGYATLQVADLVKLFDFGRSYTHKCGGFAVKKRNIRANTYWPLHDLLYLVYSMFHHHDKAVMGKLCIFYGYQPSDNGKYSSASNKFLKSIPNRRQLSEIPNTYELIQFCQREFDFVTVHDPSLPILTCQWEVV